MNASAPIEYPKPDITPVNAPYWQALESGQLNFQRCTSCHLAVLPARTECPRCLQATLEWQQASGAATLISWIVYHHSFHPAFAARLPYTVAVVELSEGARMVTNIVGIDDPERLQIDMPLILTIEREDGIAVPRFSPSAQAHC
jgi:uncharacterized protein